MKADSTRALNCATMFTTKDDSSIYAAWERFAAARTQLSIGFLNEPCPPGKATSASEDEQDEICEEAEAVIRETIAATIRGVEIKLWLLLHDLAGDEPTAMAAVREELDWSAQHGDFNGYDRLIIPAIRSLRNMQERPTQDAFAVKLARYHEAVSRRDQYDAAHRPANAEGLTPEWEAFEEAMGPKHSEVFDAAVIALLEPAPDVPALLAKRHIFDVMEMWGADEPNIMRRLFDDAVALAGGAA